MAKIKKVTYDIYKNVISFTETAYFEALRKLGIVEEHEYPEIPLEIRDAMHECAKLMTKLIKAYCRACGYDPDAPEDDEDD